MVSRTGVTGEQASLSSLAEPLIRAMRGITDKPLALGFGISKPEHTAALAGKVDAAVVGSAFVRVVEQYGATAELEARLESFARELSRGLREAG
jgi:tryptophan synthase alpha subunit